MTEPLEDVPVRVVNRDQAMEALEMVRDFVVLGDGSELTPAMREQIESLVNDDLTKVKIFMMALTRKRVAEVVDVASNVGAVEAQIESRLRDSPASFSNRDLVGLYRALSTRYRELFDSLVSTTDYGALSVEDPKYMERLEKRLADAGLTVDDARSRRRVTSLLSRVASELSEDDEDD